ncbi:alpha/beta fold hydrolase [Alkalilimnicola ehrlichii MLHE-1]|uniref:alpha/beta fold hydrolase n=1 Tax=Alkalilimnicola ehrlichii TaxID=351052 RepID=UPI00031C602D
MKQFTNMGETLCADGAVMRHGWVDGPDPTVLAVHGWSCRSDYWADQLDALAGRHRVVLPDLPGHGCSDRPVEPRSPARYAEDLETLVLERDLQGVVVMGHSMGGAVALELAARRPDRVAGVLLVDTFVIDYGGLDAATRQAIYAPFAADFPAAIQGLLEQTSTAGTPASLKARLSREMSAVDVAAVLPAWQALLAWDPAPVLERVECPVHAINGDLIPESARARWAGRIEEQRLAGCGHFLQMEDPARFNPAMSRVLDHLSGVG